jgi:hypothetical protein
MHKRFGYYRSEILRYFYEITSRIKKIKIPAKEKQICKSYKISKIRRKISKRLANYKKKTLALVLINITSPFIKSIYGFDYFLQIINSYTCKI